MKFTETTIGFVVTWCSGGRVKKVYFPKIYEEEDVAVFETADAAELASKEAWKISGEYREIFASLFGGFVYTSYLRKSAWDRHNRGPS